MQKKKFVRTFKTGQKALIVADINKDELLSINYATEEWLSIPKNAKEHSDLMDKFRKNQIVEVSFEYADGRCLVFGDEFIDEYGENNNYCIYLPTNYLKVI